MRQRARLRDWRHAEKARADVRPGCPHRLGASCRGANNRDAFALPRGSRRPGQPGRVPCGDGSLDRVLPDQRHGRGAGARGRLRAVSELRRGSRLELRTLAFQHAVLTVRGKGEIDLSVRPPNGCVVPTTGVLNASLVFTVTGGSGIYAGASGQGVLETRGGPGTTGRNTDTLGGSLSVPGLVFDGTPPVLSGAVSKTVVAPRGASAVRVTYKVKAQDPGNGSVAVTCKPRSGSSFRLGRTRVACSATDSSGNTATTRFTITIRRHR
jgi:HYR domain